MKNKILLLIIFSIMQQAFCGEERLSTLDWLGQEIKEFGYNFWTGRVKHYAKDPYAKENSSNNSYFSVYKDSDKQWRLVKDNKAIFLEKEEDSVIYFKKLYEYLKVVQKFYQINSQDKEGRLRLAAEAALEEVCSYDSTVEKEFTKIVKNVEKLDEVNDQAFYEYLNELGDICIENKKGNNDFYDYNAAYYAYSLRYPYLIFQGTGQIEINPKQIPLSRLNIINVKDRKRVLEFDLGGTEIILQMLDDEVEEIKFHQYKEKQDKEDLCLSSWLKYNAVYYTYEWINAARIKAAVGLVTLATVSVGYLWASGKLKNFSRNQAGSIE